MDSLNNITTRYLKWAPISLVIREVSRINSLSLYFKKNSLHTPKTILDVGCGDGKWWQFLKSEFPIAEIHGIDISEKEVRLASKTIDAKVHDITKPLPLGSNYDLIIGNCSLEHIFDIDAALKNISLALHEKGTFIIFVPTPFWAHKGHSIKLLTRISPRLSMMFSGALNGFFQHWHLYNHKIWQAILKDCGFFVEKSYGLGNRKSEFLFRLFLIPSFISFFFKKMTSIYPENIFMNLLPNFIIKSISKRLNNNIEENLRSVGDDDIFEYMIVCKKCQN